MLNRRLSQYIFFGSLALISLLVFLIRYLVVGGINTDISDQDRENIQLRSQIDVLNEVVQDNKDSQTSQLYDLYQNIPNVYDGVALTYKVESMLESLEITEEPDMQRTVRIDSEVSLNETSQLFQFEDKYKIVKVHVFFSTQDADDVSEFIDLLYNSQQLFIVDSLSYNTPEDDEFIGVTVNFIAIYTLQDEDLTEE